MNADNAPFLSICITSYNRVTELERCLETIDASGDGTIEIVIGEDCSPKRAEIAAVVNRFIAKTRYSVTFHPNPVNVGYDLNFANLLKLAKGEYLLFTTDDDAFRPGELDQCIAALRATPCSVAFTPYFDVQADELARKFARTMVIPKGIESVGKFLYSSILLSGLIYRRSDLRDYPAEQFKNLIYSQVYVFASGLLRADGAYIDVPLVQYIGDGENAFGTNAAAEKNALLSNRKSIYSNLEYHKGLIKVIRIFDAENGTDLLRRFAAEYSLKAYTGMRLARRVGRPELAIYRDRMKALGLELTPVVDVYYWTLRLFGARISDLFFQLPRTVLLGLRRRHVPT